MEEQTPGQKNSTVGTLISLLALAGGAWYFFGGGLEKQAATDMNKIEQQVATDAVRQYEIAKRNGNAMDACVQAGMVAAAYLQAKDETNYQHWKSTERIDCAAAGIHQ